MSRLRWDRAPTMSRTRTRRRRAASRPGPRALKWVASGAARSSCPPSASAPEPFPPADAWTPMFPVS